MHTHTYTHTQVEIICTSPLSKYTHTYILVCQDPNQAGEQKDAKHWTVQHTRTVFQRATTSQP